MENTSTGQRLIGASIRQVLFEKGLTQTDLAKMAGIERNTLSRKIHHGVFNYTELTRIADALQVKLSSIVAQAEHLANKTSK